MTTTTDPVIQLRTVDCPNCHDRHAILKDGTEGSCEACGNVWTEATVSDHVPTGKPVIEASEVIPPGGVPPTDHERSMAVERAADMALEMPEIPGKAEFLSLCVMARTLAASSIIPTALRQKPADVLVVLLTARDLAIPATTALSQIHVIDGKPTLSPKLLSARVARLGMGSIVPALKTEDKVVAAALGPNGRLDPRCASGEWTDENGRRYTHWTGPQGNDVCTCRNVLGFSSFSWTDAKQPQGRNTLVDNACEPNNHKPSCRCKDNWRNYGASRMLWQRARGYCADDWFPEASLGLYSPEELGAITDEDGEPIDVNAVALPEGFGHGGGKTAEQEAQDERISEEDFLALRARIVALPDDQKQWLRDQWDKRAEEGRLPAAKDLQHLTNREAAFGGAIIASAEQQARKAGWKPPEPTGPAAAPAQGAQEPPEATNPPAAAETVQGEPQGTAPGPQTAGTEAPVPEQWPGQASGAPEPEFGSTEAPAVDPHTARATEAVDAMTARMVSAMLRGMTLAVDKDEAVNRTRLINALVEKYVDEELDAIDEGGQS